MLPEGWPSRETYRLDLVSPSQRIACTLNSDADGFENNATVVLIVPVDGLIQRGDYKHEFALHQFTILPGGAAPKFKITQFDKIKIA